MTKMLIDRAVVEQALEALEESLYATTDKSQFLAFEAITTLRAALAEPVQEPVSKMTAGRAAFFMERFKREEKLLGPNEQAALDFVISMLEGTLAEPQEPVLNPAPGYCKHCKQYTIEEPLPAEPVQEPVAAVAKNATAQFDHAIGADRFKVVRGPFWWHVLIGDGTKKHGKFHSRAGAEQMAADLLREFRNGAFVQHTAPPQRKPQESQTTKETNK